ncbi:hypothetical protein DSO57_1005816 [Entomophthora muscae]|uniref:Uncharacterized protein n=2 Tax=Entomophthora muscae TaxID=34485 RepID=A0ACC2TIJ0_9FUNG|nr:hypothetical protein DSO57_1005816 [Entomophthora muscae]
MFWLLLLASAASSLVELDKATAHCNGIDLRGLTIKEVHLHYLTGRLTVKNVTECYLNRIHALNPSLNAVISTNPDAKSDAIKLDLKMKRGEWGSLHGIPILVKDNIAVDGMQTTAGTLFLRDIFPKQEAIAVKRLRKHGAIILGKTNLSELSGLLFPDTRDGFSFAGGQTKNPYNLTSDIFGSSSGSAAAVAANLAMAALGTETEGSLIAPSSVTSLFCFKPTYNLTLSHGTVPLAKTLDTIGVIARTASDTAILARALTSNPSLGNQNIGLRGIRVGVLEDYFNDPIVQPHINSIHLSLTHLESMGFTLVRNISFQTQADYRYPIIMGMLCEFGQQMDVYLKDGIYRQCSANPKIQNMTSIMQWYKNYPASKNYTLAALNASMSDSCKSEPAFSLSKHRHNMQSSLTQFFTRHNLQAILVPSHPEVSAFTPANIAGYPTINLPIGFNSDGSSAGLTLYGPSNSNSLLLKLAQAFDSQTYRPKFLV